MDNVLQDDRVLPDGEKKIFVAELQSLPGGTMIALDGKAYLVWRGGLYQWSFAGYTEDKVKRSPAISVQVLTPTSIVRTFSNGFVPQVHGSAFE